MVLLTRPSPKHPRPRTLQTQKPAGAGVHLAFWDEGKLKKKEHTYWPLPPPPLSPSPRPPSPLEAHFEAWHDIDSDPRHFFFFAFEAVVVASRAFFFKPLCSVTVSVMWYAWKHFFFFYPCQLSTVCWAHSCESRLPSHQFFLTFFINAQMR